MPATPSIEAAVLIPLLDASDGDNAPTHQLVTKDGSHDLHGEIRLLLTMRSQTVEHHKGQISFPGGVKDPGDSTLAHTALRETEEEVGLPRSRIRLIDMLEPVNTMSSGFLVTPYVGLIAQAHDLITGEALLLSPHEIEHPIFAPLSFFFDHPPGSFMGLPFYDFEGHRIWGATAVMISRFLQRVQKL